MLSDEENIEFEKINKFFINILDEKSALVLTPKTNFYLQCIFGDVKICYDLKFFIRLCVIHV